MDYFHILLHLISAFLDLNWSGVRILVAYISIHKLLFESSSQSMLSNSCTKSITSGVPMTLDICANWSKPLFVFFFCLSHNNSSHSKSVITSNEIWKKTGKKKKILSSKCVKAEELIKIAEDCH